MIDPAAQTIGILLIAVVIVVGGVLVLRLHAFLALTLGALAVGLLTPRATVERHVLDQNRLDVVEIDESRGEVILDAGKQRVRTGQSLLVLEDDASTGRMEEIGELAVIEINDVTTPAGRPAVEVLARIDRIDTGRSLTASAYVVTPTARLAATDMARQNVAQRVASAFGTTCGQIGILIAMASIVGKCLLDSGAADRIVRTGLKMLGERGAPLAFLWSGFLLGIPVFFDTLFYLMIPLGKAIGMRTGRNYLLYVLTIVAGGAMAHSLVPPTPGPLFVAEALGVDLGVMILAGCIVGSFTATFGYFYALAANRRWTLPLRASPDFSLEDLEELARRDERDLPPLWLSLLPILLPVVLIGGETIVRLPAVASGLPPMVLRTAATLGDKNIALLIAAAVAMVMLAWQKRAHLRELSGAVQVALASGGIIILITAAGGAFGGMLQQTGVAGLFRDLPAAAPPVVVILAFLITTTIRTAQGSATVAMITSAGILSGLAASSQLGFHPVYLALAIGCGAKPIMWMNDSGFWVITKMSGMTEAEGLKFATPMVAFMGVVGLVILLIGVTWFPMA